MWELIHQNQRKSMFLIGVLGVFTVFVGAFFGYVIQRETGLIVGAVGSLALFFILSTVAYFAADSAVLTMSGAREVTHKEFPKLWNVVEEMAIASGLPRPKIYIINDTAPNAFAVGRTPEKACVAITSGLLQKLTRDELTGVMAHEMAHIRNRDTLFMIRAAVMVGTIALMCDFFLRHFWLFGGGGGRRRDSKGGGPAQIILLVLGLLLAILAPIFARMLYMCISRRREYLADACAVEFSRNPEGLANALEKIAGDNEVLEVANRATSPLYIVNPIKAHEARAKKLFSTHPPIRERIAILRSMAMGGTVEDYDKQYRAVTKQSSGLVSAGVRQQAADERARRKPLAAHADGGQPVWGQPGAQGQGGKLPFDLQNMQGSGPAPEGTLQQSGQAARMADMQKRLEPLIRVVMAGEVAKGNLPPEAALLALYGPGALGPAGGVLMMACVCGHRMPMPSQAGMLHCQKCGHDTPISKDVVDKIEAAKKKAQQAGVQAQGDGGAPGSIPKASSDVKNALAARHHGFESPAAASGVPGDADGDGKLDAVDFDTRKPGTARAKMFEQLQANPSHGADQHRQSTIPGYDQGRTEVAPAGATPPPPPPPAPPVALAAPPATNAGTPPDDPGDDDARKALIPERLTCACGFDKPIPDNFKGSRIKCPGCGEMHIFYLVRGK